MAGDGVNKDVDLEFSISSDPISFSDDALESFPGGTPWEIFENGYRVDRLIIGINPPVDPVP